MPCNSNEKNGIILLSKKLETTRQKIEPVVEKRLEELKQNNNLFSELCFCLLTANYSAQGGINIQNKIPDFSKISEKNLALQLKELGHRFPNARANYIYLAQSKESELVLLKKMENSNKRREWLVKNIKGLGYKESSHFLRNIGYFDVAIIDKHILNLLNDYKLIQKPKTLTPKKYLEIENILKKIAKKHSMSLGELDFYLWYMKTGKVLK